MSEKNQGVVRWFNNSKGYGFLRAEDGTDIFIHYTTVEKSGMDKAEMVEGLKLEIETSKTPKGLQATRIRRVV